MFQINELSILANLSLDAPADDLNELSPFPPAHFGTAPTLLWAVIVRSYRLHIATQDPDLVCFEHDFDEQSCLCQCSWDPAPQIVAKLKMSLPETVLKFRNMEAEIMLDFTNSPLTASEEVLKAEQRFNLENWLSQQSGYKYKNTLALPVTATAPHSSSSLSSGTSITTICPKVTRPSILTKGSTLAEPVQFSVVSNTASIASITTTTTTTTTSNVAEPLFFGPLSRVDSAFKNCPPPIFICKFLVADDPSFTVFTDAEISKAKSLVNLGFNSNNNNKNNNNNNNNSSSLSTLTTLKNLQHSEELDYLEAQSKLFLSSNNLNSKKSDQHLTAANISLLQRLAALNTLSESQHLGSKIGGTYYPENGIHLLGLAFVLRIAEFVFTII